MSGLDERHKAMETELAHNSEMRFKVTNRRNKLLGLWAAEKMGLAGDPAAEYARQVVLADFEEAGDSDVVRKVLADLQAAGVATDEKSLRKVMSDLMATAHDQVVNER